METGKTDIACVNDRAIFTNDIECILGGNVGSYESDRKMAPEVGFKFSVISVPAVDLRHAVNIGQNELEQAMKSKINLMIMTAVANHINTLVLGAFGCGVFLWNVNVIAQMFKEI